MRGVVDKFLPQLEAQLAEKKVCITFSDALRKHLAKAGIDPLRGARPMRRLIQDAPRRALADELLSGLLVDGGLVSVDIAEAAAEKDKITLDMDSARNAPEEKNSRGRCGLVFLNKILLKMPRCPVTLCSDTFITGLKWSAEAWSIGWHCIWVQCHEDKPDPIFPNPSKSTSG